MSTSESSLPQTLRPAGAGRPGKPAPRTGPARRRSRARRALTSPIAYLFVAPAIAIFGIWTIFPTLYTFRVSAFDWNQLNPAMSEFIGLGNYRDMLSGSTNPSFWQTFGVSCYFVIANVVVGTILALLLALLVRRGSKLMAAARTSFFLAYIAPGVATALIWLWIFNPRFGLANGVLSLLHLPVIDWLGDSRSAMLSIIVYSVWHEVGFLVLVFVGGLMTTSGELSEAAKVDGANPWQEFSRVTLPQLIPYVAFVVIISSISSLQAFTQFFVLTGGGPGYSTSTIGFQLYQQAFVLGNTGYGAALAVVLFLITLVLSIIQLRISARLSR
ncbi:carbohydrate ABC transporter permease [Brachybacterium sp. ACRRE]|uniref:carbohydrate ABC transporter permease n=1 Tax=Brachybacterium sp. ACRRE TaxID=2918184 RepID=UPI001EF2CD3D|nr:sugar ABC transporter permease [Brachybacterium sp. ACRRE]MCG7308986.1 sugar ABC transporter permease [Brachybacterium sp. ACRRE]